MEQLQRHTRWVRATHWRLAALSIVVLAFSGFVILMAHPRLYWGEVGNDLTPALVELLSAIIGLTMSPAITASAPFLLTLFGGVQSARTIHFALWVVLMLLLAAHVLMVVLPGFRRQLRAMTVGD